MCVCLCEWTESDVAKFDLSTIGVYVCTACVHQVYDKWWSMVNECSEIEPKKKTKKKIHQKNGSRTVVIVTKTMFHENRSKNQTHVDL